LQFFFDMGGPTLGNERGFEFMVLHLHHVPGRLRVSLAALKKNREAIIPLRAELLAIPGVQSASINSITGSVIIHYDRNCFEPDAFWTILSQRGYVGQTPRCASPHTFDKMDAVASMAANAVVDALLGALLERCLGRPATTLVRLLI
jgi:hypothetical protein